MFTNLFMLAYWSNCDYFVIGCVWLILYGDNWAAISKLALCSNSILLLILASNYRLISSIRLLGIVNNIGYFYSFVIWR